MAIKKAKNIINLSNKEKIGQGLFRTCYVNSIDSTKIIKIDHKGSDGNQREFECYKKIVGEAKKFFPKCFGFVETNLGNGLMFEKISDDESYGGKNSLTLKDYLIKKDADSKKILKNKTLIPQIELLFNICIKYAILSSSLRPENIMIQRLKNNKIKVLSMDTKSIIHKEFIPLVRYFKFLQTIKIRRRARRMLNEIQNSINLAISNKSLKK